MFPLTFRPVRESHQYIGGMRRCLLAAGLVAAIASGTVTASVATTVDAANGYLIQASAKFQRLGGYWISDDPTYAGALDGLGGSSSCHLVGYDPSNVVAAWRPLAVTMNLVTFGGIPTGKTGCTAPERIRVSTVRVTGRRWYTSLGLRVGDSETKLKRMYRLAKRTTGVPGWYRAGYWLVTRRTSAWASAARSS
jgi:hypothetical protein